MKTYVKYITKEMILPTLFGISLFTFIFLIDILVYMMENIIVKSIPVLDVLEMVSYNFPPILVNTIPMGLFLGIMIAYGGLSDNSELVSLESLGIGMKRYFIPAFILGILTTLFLYYLEEKIVPDAAINLSNIKKKIMYTKPSFQIDEKVFIENIGEYNIYINKMNNETSTAKDLIVFKKDPNSVYPEIIIADVAIWESNSMILENGRFFDIDNEGKKDLSGRFDKQVIPINTFFGSFKLDNERKKEMMGITELKNEIIKRKTEGKEVLQYRVEYQKKLAIPITAIILSVIGVMLSVKNNRSGKGVSFGVSLIIITIYMLSINFGEMMADKGNVPPVIGIWFPNFILFIFAILLTYNQFRRR